MSARLVVVVAAVAALSIHAGEAFAAPCWRPPVDSPVVDAFREPECRWCPGNRGLEYGSEHGDPVRAVATGEVTYSGVIAGVRYVVVQHANGWRATYGNLITARHRVGDVVVRGTSVGDVAGRLHFGLRDGDRYIDPAPFLGVLVRRARLTPLDGSAANPAPAPRLRCSVPLSRSSPAEQRAAVRW